MSDIRRFTAYRKLDISATHNASQVNSPDEPQYEGVVFSDGTCVLRWLTALRSTSVWASLDEAMGIHGHPEYGTVIEWHDSPLPLPWENNTPPTQEKESDKNNTTED